MKYLIPLLLTLCSTTLSMAQRPFLGVHIGHMTEQKAEKLELPNPYGTFVTHVIPGTAAEAAGLQPFDYIIGIDDMRASEDQDLGDMLGNYEVGDEVSVMLIRQGKSMTRKATLKSRGTTVVTRKDRCEKAFLGVKESHNRLPSSLSGVPVNIVPNSSAAALGMKDGDVLISINNFTMLDWDDIGIALKMVQPGDKVSVEFVRDWNKQKASTEILSYCDVYGEDEETALVEKIIEEERQSLRSSNRGIQGMKVEIMPMPAERVQEMKQQFDIEMPTDNNLNLRELRIFPNPGAGMFMLEFDLPRSGDTEIRIYNSSGRQIYQSELMGFSGNYQDEIDITQNGPGNYFLMIRQNGRSLTRQIIVAD